MSCLILDKFPFTSNNLLDILSCADHYLFIPYTIGVGRPSTALNTSFGVYGLWAWTALDRVDKYRTQLLPEHAWPPSRVNTAPTVKSTVRIIRIICREEGGSVIHPHTMSSLYAVCMAHYPKSRVPSSVVTFFSLAAHNKEQLPSIQRRSSCPHWPTRMQINHPSRK